ncbi:hypothetical protein [Pragia fontium]|uniref:hypothetical protein n=1 Tax=Pragia fontium TaxID=82985 RepID=UPI0011875B16|nr:hypothetical protein [Pragia fontium]
MAMCWNNGPDNIYRGSVMPEHPVAGKVLIATLGSWRYFSALSGMAMLFVLVMLLSNSYSLVVLAVAVVLGLVCQYYCWRLWLDCHLFQIFYQYPEKSDVFDTAINMCWGREGENNRSLASRWSGARRLLYLAAGWMLVQWGTILLSLVVYGLQG